MLCSGLCFAFSVSRLCVGGTLRTSGKTRRAPLPAPLQCPGREGCTVVAGLEQHCDQGLDISLWHFQGSWLLGAQREPGWVVKSGGIQRGYFPAVVEVWWAPGLPLGMGLPTLLCSHAASFSAPR